jgi:hypothetical protein
MLDAARAGRYTQKNRNGARLGADIAIRREERRTVRGDAGPSISTENADRSSGADRRRDQSDAGFVLNATLYRTGESVCTGAALMAGIGAAVGAGIGALVSR